MPDCPSSPTCPFFNDHMAHRPATAAMMKASFCRGDNSQCARWLVAGALGKQAVPTDLYPSDISRARSIIQ